VRLHRRVQRDPAVPGIIISLADARRGLGLPTAAIAKDETCGRAIAAATPIMEDLVGPILSRTCDEWHDGGSRTVRLLQSPVLSVQSVSESYGNFVRTLTAQPLDGSTFDAYGYTIDLVDGILPGACRGSPACSLRAGATSSSPMSPAGR
jgi:hypothetical protein